MNKTENRGGARTSLTKKIGRPKGIPTVTISFRVPVDKKNSFCVVEKSKLEEMCAELDFYKSQNSAMSADIDKIQDMIP